MHLLQSSALYQLYVSLPEKEPFLFIMEDCPPDIKKRPLEEWPKVKAATKRGTKKDFILQKITLYNFTNSPTTVGFILVFSDLVGFNFK